MGKRNPLLPKETPLVFSGDSIDKIFAGTKTETRRVVQPQPPTPEEIRAYCGHTYGWRFEEGLLGRFDHWQAVGDTRAVEAVRERMGRPSILRPRYGLAGDRFWVREEHWTPPERIQRSVVKYDGNLSYDEKMELRREGWTRRKGWYMKRAYCRLVLEIQQVEIERLQDITEDGAKREGVTTHIPDDGLFWCGGSDATLTDERNPAFRIERAVRGYRGGFGMLWNILNGKTWPWNINPWVWPFRFRILDGCLDAPLQAVA